MENLIALNDCRQLANAHTGVPVDGMQMCYKMDKLQMAVQKVKVSETRLHKALRWELDKRWKVMAWWFKWLGCSPGLWEVQVWALSDPPFFT